MSRLMTNSAAGFSNGFTTFLIGASEVDTGLDASAGQKRISNYLTNQCINLDGWNTGIPWQNLVSTVLS